MKFIQILFWKLVCPAESGFFCGSNSKTVIGINGLGINLKSVTFSFEDSAVPDDCKWGVVRVFFAPE